MSMSKESAIFAEDMPIYGWTRVRHTSKFVGGAYRRCMESMMTVTRLHPNRACYIKYNGVKFVNRAYAAQYPKHKFELISAA